MNILSCYKGAYFCKKRYLALRGGAASGKSWFAAQKITSRILNETDHTFLVLRKVAATIKTSTFQLFKDVIETEELSSQFIYNNSDFTITCRLNSNKILFKGLDEAEKIKSIQGITGMFIEEASEFTEADWKQLQLRIRGVQKNYVQFILCFNPISEHHWLKRVFWDSYDIDAYTLVTTYKDNIHLSQEDIKHFEERLVKDAMAYQVYALGQWGSLRLGGELVKDFNYEKHVKSLSYDPLLPLHISFDFNVLPHCSVSCFQIKDKQIYGIDEIAEDFPFNLTLDACNEFSRRYSDHKSGLFVYGDVAGKHQDTRSEAGFNDYIIIQNALIDYHPTFRIGNKAPSVVMSTNFLNALLRGDIQDRSITFNKKCLSIINDLNYLKQNEEGGKLIEYEKNPVNGVRQEKYGHFFDNLRYMLIVYLEKEYLQYINARGVKGMRIIRSHHIASHNHY